MINIRNFLLIFIFASLNLVQAEITRIMPLGDSITYDWSFSDLTNPRPITIRSGYRNYLWYQLQDQGYDVDFVGSYNAGSAIIPTFDPDNEGYPGMTTMELANIVYNKLVQNPADIILLHIGTNDWSIDTLGLSIIFDEIQRYEDNYQHPITIIAARIINAPSYYPHISTFNENLQNLVNTRITDYGDDIIVVDMEYGAGLNYTTDFYDSLHPNNIGYQKMATVWYNTLKDLLDGEDYSYLIPVYNLLL